MTQVNFSLRNDVDIMNYEYQCFQIIVVDMIYEMHKIRYSILKH